MQVSNVTSNDTLRLISKTQLITMRCARKLAFYAAARQEHLHLYGDGGISAISDLPSVVLLCAAGSNDTS
jgi:hypothetical protein